MREERNVCKKKQLPLGYLGIVCFGVEIKKKDEEKLVGSRKGREAIRKCKRYLRKKDRSTRALGSSFFR